MKNILLSLIVLISFPVMLCAQVWEGRNAAFPTSLWGDGIYAIDDTVAWCWGIEVDTNDFFTFANPAISVTTNAGLNWHHVEFPTSDTCFISSLSALNDQIAWLTYVKIVNRLDADSHIVKTEDGGHSWTSVNLTVNVFVDFIYMWSEMEGLVVGDPDADGFEIYKTVDGGVSWERFPNLPPPLNTEFIWADNYEVKGDQLWFATTKGRIFHTADRGVSWEVWASPFGGFEADNMNVSDDGDVYLSFNNFLGLTEGADWFLYRRNASDGKWVNITEPDHNYYMYDIKPIPGSNVVLSSVNDWLDGGFQTKISYNRGSTWSVIDQTEITYFDFFNAEVGYASQYNLAKDLSPTLVYRYTGSPLTSLFMQTPLQGVELSLSPNPTSDIITVSLTSNSESDYWILLNDLSGQLIYKYELSKVSEIRKTIDLETFPSGTYMITIANTTGMRSEKILKL